MAMNEELYHAHGRRARFVFYKLVQLVTHPRPGVRRRVLSFLGSLRANENGMLMVGTRVCFVRCGK